MLESFVSLGIDKLSSYLVSSGSILLNKYKTQREWKQLFVDTGKIYIDVIKDSDKIFNEVSDILSKSNMEQLAKLINGKSGYEIKGVILDYLLSIISKYEVPYNEARLLAEWFTKTIIEQLPEIAPEVFDQYFLKDWRDIEEQALSLIYDKIIETNRNQQFLIDQKIKIHTVDDIDLNLRESTINPSIGLDFFSIDDDSFKEAFDEKRSQECIYIKTRSSEEGIYCILNELLRLEDDRPIFVIRSEEGWQKLKTLDLSGYVFIPWFFSDEITPIPNNTNIFVYNDDIPVGKGDVLILRPRMISTISNSLKAAGMDPNDAYNLATETHGLYIPMKRKLFKGIKNNKPKWCKELKPNIKKTCLLVGQWTDCEGDIAVIEELSGITYQEFMESVLEYSNTEEPLIYVISIHGENKYVLSSVENSWEYISIDYDDEIWKKFKELFLIVIDESETLFTYDQANRLAALLRGEKYFWSKYLRNGMMRSLIMRAFYKRNADYQSEMDQLVETILSKVNTVEKWKYISQFFVDLCEISPKAIIKRIRDEKNEPTGLWSLFENNTDSFSFERNYYIDILWGLEELLVQKEFFTDGLKLILEIDDKGIVYHSNSPKDTLEKVFCTWINFSAAQTPAKKIKAAKLAFSIDNNIWDAILHAFPQHRTSYVGELYGPKYRERVERLNLTWADVFETEDGYLPLLLKYAGTNPERWIKLLKLSEELSDTQREIVFSALLEQESDFNDEEIYTIKNTIRKIIHNHRFYKNASWAMPEEKLAEYEKLLNSIHTKKEEFEYVYLFTPNYDFALLHPFPFESDNYMDDNDKRIEEIIKEGVCEFKKKGLKIEVLSAACSKMDNNTLGPYLAKYWNEGSFDFNIFNILLKVQKNGNMAVDYYNCLLQKEDISFEEINATIQKYDLRPEDVARFYLVEAIHTTGLPKILNSPDSIKNAFWKMNLIRLKNNTEIALDECKKYGSLGSYLSFLYYRVKEKNYDNEFIYNHLLGIEYIDDRTHEDSMTGYYLTELLKPLQREYIFDLDKRHNIARIEMAFFALLEWEDMICFQREIKESPELFADIVSIIYKKDSINESVNLTEKEKNYKTNLYRLFDMAKFCPTEDNGVVEEEKLFNWINRLKELLRLNDQSSLLTFLLGRLFAFSPIGADNHMPCESVRKAIEKYGDDRLSAEYRSEIFNSRGVFSPTAGKAELAFAKQYKDNADYLSLEYHKTAEIYYELYRWYKIEAENERKSAEYGW